VTGQLSFEIEVDRAEVIRIARAAAAESVRAALKPRGELYASVRDVVRREVRDLVETGRLGEIVASTLDERAEEVVVEAIRAELGKAVRATLKGCGPAVRAAVERALGDVGNGASS